MSHTGRTFQHRAFQPELGIRISALWFKLKEDGTVDQEKPIESTNEMINCLQ